MESILKYGSNKFRVFEGKMDSQKYVCMLESNIIKIKEMSQKMDIDMSYDSKHKSNVSLKFYI